MTQAQEEILIITEPQAQTQEPPAQAPACNKAAAPAADADKPAKKPRRVLTLEEREEKARAQASRAAQRLSRVQAEKKRQDLHRKACIGEVVIALAALDKGDIVDAILNGANKRKLSIDDHHREIIQALYPPTPEPQKKATEAAP